MCTHTHIYTHAHAHTHRSIRTYTYYGYIVVNLEVSRHFQVILSFLVSLKTYYWWSDINTLMHTCCNLQSLSTYSRVSFLFHPEAPCYSHSRFEVTLTLSSFPTNLIYALILFDAVRHCAVFSAFHFRLTSWRWKKNQLFFNTLFSLWLSNKRGWDFLLHKVRSVNPIPPGLFWSSLAWEGVGGFKSPSP